MLIKELSYSILSHFFKNRKHKEEKLEVILPPILQVESTFSNSNVIRN